MIEDIYVSYRLPCVPYMQPYNQYCHTCTLTEQRKLKLFIVPEIVHCGCYT